MGTPKIKSKDDMRRLKEEMEKWMEVREETAKRQVSDADEVLKRVLGENAKVKKALGAGTAVALVPPPQDKPLTQHEKHRNELRSPCGKPVHDNEVTRAFEEPLEQQPHTHHRQGTTQIAQNAGFLEELEQLRLQVAILRNENWRLESTHKIDQETIEGLRLEMQEAITELDELRTRQTAKNVHSSSAPIQQTQHGEVHMLPTPLITPRAAEAPHNLQRANAPVQSLGDNCPPKISEKPKVKRKKRKAAVMPTPIEPVLFVDPTCPQESSIQSYQQKMYLLQVKVYSQLPVDVSDIPWPILPLPGNAYPIMIHGRKEIKLTDVMEFAGAFWIGGNGLAKERAVEMISAWSWMCIGRRVKCTKDLRSWIGRTTTFLRQAKEKLAL
jgi:hypothetical protein